MEVCGGCPFNLPCQSDELAETCADTSNGLGGDGLSETVCCGLDGAGDDQEDAAEEAEGAATRQIGEMADEGLCERSVKSHIDNLRLQPHTQIAATPSVFAVSIQLGVVVLMSLAIGNSAELVK
jgi:hypothetical protein